jgi:hypothetical protein
MRLSCSAAVHNVALLCAAMGFPSTPDTRIRSRNDALSVAMLLREQVMTVACWLPYHDVTLVTARLAA